MTCPDCKNLTCEDCYLCHTCTACELCENVDCYPKLKWIEYDDIRSPRVDGEYYVINANWSRTIYKCIYSAKEDTFFLRDKNNEKDLPLMITHWIDFPDLPEGYPYAMD